MFDNLTEIGKLTVSEVTKLIEAQEEVQRRYKETQEELLEDLTDLKSYVVANKRDLAISVIERLIRQAERDITQVETISFWGSEKDAYEIDKRWEEQ